MLVPSSNRVVEPELPSMLPDGVAVHTTRLRLVGGGTDELLAMTEKVEEAAELVSHAGVESPKFAGLRRGQHHGSGHLASDHTRLAEPIVWNSRARPHLHTASTHCGLLNWDTARRRAATWAKNSALASAQRCRHRDPGAKLVGLVWLAVADAFHFGSVQAVGKSNWLSLPVCR